MSIFVNPAYRYDEDLEFLQYMPSKDLDDLVYVLTHDPSDGELRVSEELTSNPDYKKYYPDHHKYWRVIATELQTFGANTFATIVRGGQGVLYKEILTDVCDKLKVEYNKEDETKIIEQKLLMKVVDNAVQKMSKEDLRKLGNKLNLKNIESMTPLLMTSNFLAIFNAGGFESYQLTLIIVNAVVESIIGRGLTLGADALLAEVLDVVTGPIGWIVTGVWAIWSIAGPAYRVTIPAVFIVAALREKYLYGM